MFFKTNVLFISKALHEYDANANYIAHRKAWLSYEWLMKFGC